MLCVVCGFDVVPAHAGGGGPAQPPAPVVAAADAVPADAADGANGEQGTKKIDALGGLAAKMAGPTETLNFVRLPELLQLLVDPILSDDEGTKAGIAELCYNCYGCPFLQALLLACRENE